MLLFRLLRRLLSAVVHVFFRQIVVVGVENIPPEGTPVIFAGNHPNSLLDPAILLSTCTRVVHFAAKDTLFRSPFARWFLGALGAVPIRRRMDHAQAEGQPLDNSATFERLVDALERGRAMGIFPEGVSHDRAQLQRLKTGVARIALDGARRGLAVHIVPCGLNYVRPKRFRSRALVQYGAPILVDAAALGGDEREAAVALTEQVEAALRGLTVNADDWETLRVLDAVRRLYQPPRVSLADRTELARRFSAVYPRVRDRPDVQALYQRVAAWLARLDAVGIGDRELGRSLSAWEVTRRVARQLALVLLWLPLAAPGFVVQAPVVYAIRLFSPRLTPRKDVLATTKLLLGMLLLPAFNVLVGVVVALRFGLLAGAVVTGLLFLSAVATIKVLERGARLRQILGATSRVLRLRGELGELRAERSALEAEVLRAVERYKPEDMVALFPRAAVEG